MKIEEKIRGLISKLKEMLFRKVVERRLHYYLPYVFPAIAFSISVSDVNFRLAFIIMLMFYVLVFPRNSLGESAIISSSSVLFFLSLYLLKNVDVEDIHFLSSHHLFLSFPFFVFPSILVFIIDRRKAIYLCVLLAMSSMFIFPEREQTYLAISSSWALGSMMSFDLLVKSRRRSSIFKVASLYGLFGSTLIAIILAKPLDVFIFMSSAILSPFISISVLYFLERFFDVLTPFYLFDLQDIEHPLLVQLRTKAPGTFHHSLVVSDIAYIAAKEVGANAELVRCAALYHDIGKIVRPEYFIENIGEISPHLKINILLSSKLIIKHVEDGKRIAEASSLPKRIIDFILEHHGTTYPEYFVKIAKKFNIQLDARYPGPRPRTLETVIMMICDSAEAAVRSLEEYKVERINEVVAKIIRSKLEQGQFDDAPVTIKQLKKIQEAVTKALVDFYHVRISYDEKGIRKYLDLKRQLNNQSNVTNNGKESEIRKKRGE